MIQQIARCIQIFCMTFSDNFIASLESIGTHGGAFGWDTVGFQMVPLEFFIGIIIPATLWPRGHHNL